MSEGKFISMFIFCERDVSLAKVTDSRGNVRREWTNNSVGPGKHVNVCLKEGCECDRLLERLIELYGD